MVTRSVPPPLALNEWHLPGSARTPVKNPDAAAVLLNW
jgi:hypothetical protein